MEDVVCLQAFQGALEAKLGLCLLVMHDRLVALSVVDAGDEELLERRLYHRPVVVVRGWE
jgi:hypothetical protein